MNGKRKMENVKRKVASTAKQTKLKQPRNNQQVKKRGRMEGWIAFLMNHQEICS